ncbi:hypothetical protein FRC01_003329 [Tulasnella sp. 417]|nr:hypothetical protein FRC01_003329 [Tulasnella sp. 417]
MSAGQAAIFDGVNEPISFDTFVHQLASSENWIDTTGSSFLDLADQIVPSFLCGAALRYYETLDRGCQCEWPLLRDAMAGRFPGGIRSGGTIQRSQMKWEEDGLKTRAQQPPFTFTTPMVSVSTEEGSASEAAVKHESSYTPLFSLKSKLWGYLSTPSPNPTNVPKESQITVHSIFIRYAHGGTAWKPQSTTTLTSVDLTDLQSVTACQERPLLTILSNDNAERYQIGYTFTVHHGERIIDFHHGVQTPRSARMCHIQPTGNHTVSPERHWSGASPITDFIPHTSNAYLPGKRPLPGKYVIRSHLGSRKPGTYRNHDPNNELEELGAITWILQVASE